MIFDWLSPSHPLTIAHRGASAYAPANSIAAFECAAQLGADMWEVDIHLTADGQMIAHHDDALPDGRLIRNVDYGEICCAVSYEVAPLLQDVTALALRLGCGLYADIKSDDAAASVSEYLSSCGVERAIIGVRNDDTITQLKAAATPYPCAIMVPAHADPFSLGVEADILHLCWEKMDDPQKLLDIHFFERCATLGKKVVLWHEQDPEKIRVLRKLPVLGICSDRPEIVNPYHAQTNRPICIVCHRGANMIAPENTLPAMHAAFGAGFSHVEIDVHVTAAGELVIIHDPSLERTTNGAGLVCEQTLARLRELDAGSWMSNFFVDAKIPTLTEALELASGYQGKLYIELKNAPAETVWRAVLAAGMEEDCFFWSFSASSLRDLRALSPKPKIMARRQDFGTLAQALQFLEPSIIEFAGCDDWSEICDMQDSDHKSMIAYNGSDLTIFSKIEKVRPDLVNLDQPFLFSNFVEHLSYLNGK